MEAVVGLPCAGLVAEDYRRLKRVNAHWRIAVLPSLEHKPLCAIWDRFAVIIFEPHFMVSMLRDKPLHVPYKFTKKH